MTRSPREERMAQQLKFMGSSEESPEGRAERQERNWYEMRQTLKEKKAPFAVLDKELSEGRGIDFPENASWDATDDDGFVADDDGFVPDQPAPRASQGDVRAAETPMSPLQSQEADERVFDEARRKHLKKTGGLIIRTPAEERAAVSKATGLRDPKETRDAAVADEMIQTGEYVADDTLGYEIAKAAAGIAGFSVAGPAGATVVEALVRLVTVNANLDRAVARGMDPAIADGIRDKALRSGIGTDALFNFGIPILGKLAMKIPGAESALKALKNAAGNTIGKVVKLPGSGAADDLTGIKRAGRAQATDDPVRQKAATELQKRMEGDFVLTPGQVRGETGGTEAAVQRAFPHTFMPQERAAQKGADQLLRETIEPDTYMGREQFGRTIHDIAEKTKSAVQARLRPVFQRADDIGVTVSMNRTRHIAARELLDSQRVPGGSLKPNEETVLNRIVDELRSNPERGPQYALDFISRRKEELRAITADGVPSTRFQAVVNKMIASAEAEYERAAKFADPALYKDLIRARRDYGHMMETIYEDAIKTAWKKDPEQVGKMLWQPGNTARVAQLRHMLFLAEKEGVIGAAANQKIRADAARGFLQQGVRDVESASKWSETLKKNVEMRDTWRALTHGAAGRELDSSMKVVEKAAQMALHSDAREHAKGFIALGRAAQGGLGISLVTGAIHAPMFVAGVSVAGSMKLLATAYAHGDKGTINLVSKVLRMRGVTTPAGLKALQKATEDLAKKTQEYSIPVEEMFEVVDEGLETGRNAAVGAVKN